MCWKWMISEDVSTDPQSTYTFQSMSVCESCLAAEGPKRPSMMAESLLYVCISVCVSHVCGAAPEADCLALSFLMSFRASADWMML